MAPHLTPPYTSFVQTVTPSGDTSGVTDTLAIQAAINKVQANVFPNQGGLVNLANGMFRVNAPLTITSDNISIAGAGLGNPTGNRNTNSNPQYGGTVIQPVSSFIGSNVLAVGQSGTPTRTLSGVFLKDFSLDCAQTPANTNGIFYQSFKGGMANVYVFQPTLNGVVIDGNGSPNFPNGAWDNHYYNVAVDGNTTFSGLNGFLLQNGAVDNVFTECTSKYMGGDGYNLDSGAAANRWLGGYIYSCLGKGINSANMFQLKILGIRFQDLNGGVYLASPGGTAGFLIVGNTFRNMSAATDNTTDAVNITASGSTRGGLIDANDFYGNAGNTNGGTAPNKNRTRNLINIVSGNITTVRVGFNSQGFDASAVSACFGTSYLVDNGTNTLVMGEGQSGLPEIKHSGGVRMLWRSTTPAGATTANIGSLVARTDTGALYGKSSGASTSGWGQFWPRKMFKTVTAAVTPSATLNTFGATTTISPNADFQYMEAAQVRLVSGGTFGAETLTVNVVFTFSDANTQTFAATFTATAQTTDMTTGNLNVNAFKDGVMLVSVGIKAQSTINSSTANVVATVSGFNA